MPSPIFLGGKVLQERINVLEEELHQERLLTQRNATQAIQFQKAMEAWMEWFQSGAARYEAPSKMTALLLEAKESRDATARKFTWEEGDVRIIKHGSRH